jgi:hypothetical protein
MNTEPRRETTDRALGLLVEYGFRVDSSMFDADLPHVRELPGGSITEIPVSWALDDGEKYAFWPGVTGQWRQDQPRPELARLGCRTGQTFASHDINGRIRRQQCQSVTTPGYTSGRRLALSALRADGVS